MPKRATIHPDADRRLDDALAALPRERAGHGFTAGVTARLDAGRAAPRRWPLVAAAALLLLACAFGAREWHHQRQQQAAVERIAALRAEYRLIEAELERLRRQTDAARPVLYLGGTEDLDLVVDLARLAEARDQNPRNPALRGAAGPRPADLDAGHRPERPRYY